MNKYSRPAKIHNTNILGNNDKLANKMDPDIHAMDWKKAATPNGKNGNVHMGNILLYKDNKEVSCTVAAVAIISCTIYGEVSRDILSMDL